MIYIDELCIRELDGRDYRGCVNVTATGTPCQHWSEQSPHEHSRIPTNYPGLGLGDHNFCRNPDGEQRVWCYTTDPDQRWEYCNLGDQCFGKEHFGIHYSVKLCAQLRSCFVSIF